MLAIFLLVVTLVAYRQYSKYDAMLSRYRFHMVVSSDLAKEEAEALSILMSLISLTAFIMFILGGFNILPNFF